MEDLNKKNRISIKEILHSPRNLVLILWAILLIFGYTTMIASKTASTPEQMTEIPTPSASPSPSASPTVSSTPYVPVATPFRAVSTTPLPTSISNSSPTPASSPTSNSASTPDTTPPTIVQMTGPSDGSTVDFNSFCFPLYPHDDRTDANNILERKRFDTDTWSDWSKDTTNCYSNVSNGQHIFAVEIKDEAGNSSGASRNFTVQVN